MTIHSSEADRISLLGVDYTHLKRMDGGELYLTNFGFPFREQLAPENWYAQDWFASHRTRLEGTSAIYRVPTRPVRSQSLNLVVRFSRVGQEVPLQTFTRKESLLTEFNSPFEEFALVMKLRAGGLSRSRPRILTKRPLAIYVPAEKLQDWQSGRLESKMAAKVARHPEVKLDMFRQYILLYGWIKGLNAVEATHALGMVGSSADEFLKETTLRAIHELEQNGFRVADIKPEHVVLRIEPNCSFLRLRNGKPAYALVDYELLEPVEESG